MNSLRLVAAVVFAVVMVSSVRAEERKADYAKLIVSTWEVAKADEGDLPVASVIEFAKDGLMLPNADQPKAHWSSPRP